MQCWKTPACDQQIKGIVADAYGNRKAIDMSRFFEIVAAFDSTETRRQLR